MENLLQTNQTNEQMTDKKSTKAPEKKEEKKPKMSGIWRLAKVNYSLSEIDFSQTGKNEKHNYNYFTIDDKLPAIIKECFKEWIWFKFTNFKMTTNQFKTDDDLSVETFYHIEKTDRNTISIGSWTLDLEIFDLETGDIIQKETAQNTSMNIWDKATQVVLTNLKKELIDIIFYWVVRWVKETEEFQTDWKTKPFQKTVKQAPQHPVSIAMPKITIDWSKENNDMSAKANDIFWTPEVSSNIF